MDVPDDYKVFTFSMWPSNSAAIDRAVDALRRRGVKNVSRSRVIRLAIATFDAEQINLDTVEDVK